MADEPTTDNLTPAQHRAVSALLVEGSIRHAAEAAGVKERTLYHWLKHPVFADEYRSARREATRAAVAKLQQVSGKAAERLEHLLTHGTPATQLGAARAILEFSIKAVELEDLEQRLAALEAAYAAKV
jgi:hypothetical protein